MMLVDVPGLDDNCGSALVRIEFHTDERGIMHHRPEAHDVGIGR
jgi:hypothetical protein